MARYKPALLGGLFIGVLSVLPVISGLNACCCLWVVVGGVLTTYLMQQNEALPLETSVAALAGLLAGAVGGVVQAVGNALMLMTGLFGQREAMEQMVEQMRDLPPEFGQYMERIMSSPAMPLLGGAITVPVFAVFGLLGGLLGLAFFRKKSGPPVAPVDPGQTPTLR